MCMKIKKLLGCILFLVFVTNQLFAQSDNIKITYKRNSNKSVDFYYTKKLPGSFYLSVRFTKLENSNSFDYSDVIKAKSGYLFTLRPIDNRKSIRFSYKRSWLRGVPNPKTDSLFTYGLPFKEGVKVLVRENKNVGEKYFGSEKPSKWKSYAAYVKTTDTVCSMRKGIVVGITNKYENDTISKKKFTTKRNSVRIEHQDGTIASYYGFKKNSFLVS